KSQTLAGGATDGKGNAYATTKDVATGLNNGLSTKVTDNKNGTEQLNGVQVQPFNKLSDSVGGRNLLKGTAKCDFPSSSNGGTQTVEKYDDETNYIQNTSNTPTNRMGPWFPLMPEVGQVYTFSADVCGNGYIPRGNFHYEGGDDGSLGQVDLTNDWQRISNTFRVNTDVGQVNWIIYANNSTLLKVKHIKVEKGSLATVWTPAPEDKVNVSDMRKPASNVAGIEEVNAKQDKIGYTPADDSKVAHLSGANNFDTVPTVNNNPLLLASSLPSDLARTGSDQEFTGKNTFDTAPIDKTTGNPYITKDGIPAVPSTLADTTKDANFTGKLQKSGIDVATKSDVATAVSAVNANMVHRNPDTGSVSEPVDFTNLTVNGGKSVATRDDLKSLETSAWRVLDNKCITAFTKYNTSIKVDENSLFLVKIDEVNKRVYMFFTILGNFVENSSIYIDLTSIVKNLSFPSYHLYYLEGNTASSTADGSIVGNRICFKIQIYDTTVLNSKYSSYMVNANDAGWIYSSCFVNYDELV
ncbi:hypothetical protein ABDA31_09355, partial [Levilactobacillus brevis]